LRNRKRLSGTDQHIEETRKYASDIVWSFRKQRRSKEKKGRDFEKHVSNPNRRAKKDKIIMTLFLKAKWENIIMAIMKLILAIHFTRGVELDLFDGKFTSVCFMFMIPNYLS
jgi:uncharacterized integral membrane protein